MSGVAGADQGATVKRPRKPTGLTVTAAPTALTLRWSPAIGAVAYTAYLDSNPIGSTTSTSWTFSGLECATKHRVEVDAVDDLNRHSGKKAVKRKTSPCVPLPVVSSFAPAGGATGTSVTITGSDLGGATTVTFNGTPAPFTITSSATITATVPSSATTGPIAVTTPAGTGTSATPYTVTATPPQSSNASVFVAPPASAGLGTNGSDTDAANCVRFSTAVPAPPGGSGVGCATFQRAYQLAQSGDTVYLNWSGAWSTSQQIGASANKTTSARCRYPTDTSGCINFTPVAGSQPTVSGGLQICADYVQLSNFDFNSATYTDTYGDTVSKPAWWVGKGDSTCQPSGAPPHDIYIHNVDAHGPAGITGGAFGVYVLGGSIGNSYNLPVQFGGSGNNGQTPGVHNSTIDGVTFHHFLATDLANHHMECVHMDYAGDSNTVQNSRFQSCPVYSIRVEAEGNPGQHANTQTNHLFQNNFFDGAPLNFDCHDNGCALTGNVVRFNTFGTGGFTPTNDCAQSSGNTCSAHGNTFYGNLVNNGCSSNAAIYGLGWSSFFNVYAGNGGGNTICATDTTSSYGAQIRLVSPGAPNYDDHLSTCTQVSANLLAPPNLFTQGSANLGAPLTDIDGVGRPKSGLLDAGASETC
jgi:hypothetical protein